MRATCCTAAVVVVVVVVAVVVHDARIVMIPPQHAHAHCNSMREYVLRTARAVAAMLSSMNGLGILFLAPNTRCIIITLCVCRMVIVCRLLT